MDETTLSTLLEELAADPAPAAAVDIAAARHRGRRRLRWRRAGLAAAPLAAAAAAALIVTGTVPFPRGGNGNAPAAARPAAALAPSASFGWLPAGFSLRRPSGLAIPDIWTPRSLTLNAWSPAAGRVLTLKVTLLSSCHLSPRPPGTHFQLACAGGAGLPVTAAAPAVLGARAYWSVGGGLLWQYRPGVWAQLSPGTLMPSPGLPRTVAARRWHRSLAGWQSSPPMMGYPATVQSAATRALLRTVAAHVSYGGGAVLFPFRLTGLPASWRANVARLTAAGGRLLDTSLMLGPASNLGALTISATPTAGTLHSACGMFRSGPSQSVTIGRAQGFQRIINQPGRQEQDLCLADYHGWSLKLYLRLNVSGSSQRLPGAPSGVLAVLHHLRLLGPDPARWTRSPLG